MECQYIAEALPELLNLSNPPASISWLAETASVAQCIQRFFFLISLTHFTKSDIIL